MLTVYVSVLTLLFTLYAPASSQSEAERKAQQLTGGSIKVWVLVKIDDRRLGGPQKQCPAWTFDNANRTVEWEDNACDGRKSSANWDVKGTSPDIKLVFKGNVSRSYRITLIGPVPNSDTEELQLEDRSNDPNVVSAKLYFEHYPR
jgi:hypothetical protein